MKPLIKSDALLVISPRPWYVFRLFLFFFLFFPEIQEIAGGRKTRMPATPTHGSGFIYKWHFVSEREWVTARIQDINLTALLHHTGCAVSAHAVNKPRGREKKKKKKKLTRHTGVRWLLVWKNFLICQVRGDQLVKQLSIKQQLI